MLEGKGRTRRIRRWQNTLVEGKLGQEHVSIGIAENRGPVHKSSDNLTNLVPVILILNSKQVTGDLGNAAVSDMIKAFEE
jgi:hypothetical protein